jgi:protein TonB
MFARANPDEMYPPLFSNLISSKPPRQGRDSATATTASVLFHAAILTALVLATLTVNPEVIDVKPDSVIYIDRVSSLPSTVPPAPPAAAPAPNPGTTAPVFNMPAPIIDPGVIPPPAASPIIGNEPPDYEHRVTTAPGGTPGGATGSAPGVESAPVFTPFTVAPILRNRDEFARELMRNYPAILREAGIGGEVLVWLLIDVSGNVLRANLTQSSGHATLDQAALKVALTMKFTPAKNRDQTVQVWVSLPIRFTAK